MKPLIISIIICLVSFSCCNISIDKTASDNLFSPDSLQTEQFSINVNRDTVLQTKNGAWLKITKGTLSGDKDMVTLEVKEAYSMHQIIKAGLVTESNGQALSSGGMIYINAAAGQKVTFNKPIKIAIPTGHLDRKMELYKGTVAADGNINWENPKKLSENKQLSDIEKGAVLFQQKCASCHGIGKEGTGPDLANLKKRFGTHYFGEDSRTLEFNHEFAKIYYPYSIENDGTDTGKVHFEYDKGYSNLYICNLISLYQNKEVNLSKDFNNNSQEWIKIYNYIENESNKKNLPYPRHAYLDSCVDSCNRFKALKQIIEEKKSLEEQERNGLIKDNGPLVDKRPDGNWIQGSIPPPGFNDTPLGFNDKVEPPYYDATYYQFTIDSFGWFNVDILLNKTDGVEESELFVRITGAYKERVKIFLIIPSVKVYGEGGPSSTDKEAFAFFKKDGSIPLPQNTKAFILAITETEGSIAFALKDFTTQIKQTISLSLQSSTKSSFDAAISGIDIDRLHISVNQSKNAKAIKDLDKTIKELEIELKNAEKIKSTRCDCECGTPLPGTVDLPIEK
jgi:hypothetical protein